MAFYQLEPFGDEAEDWRMAQLLALIANVNRDPKKRRRPFTPEEFMPKRGATKAVDQETLRFKADMIMRALGGKEKPRGGDPGLPGGGPRLPEPKTQPAPAAQALLDRGIAPSSRQGRVRSGDGSSQRGVRTKGRTPPRTPGEGGS
jgi:hypothetical protein